MKAAIDREELLRGVSAVLDVVPSKTALPVLSNILIDASDSKAMRLSATDLDISIVCTLDASIEHPGATTVPARKFAEITRELPDQALQLTAEEGQVTIQRQGNAEGTYVLMSVPAEDFPELPSQIEGPELLFTGDTDADKEADGDVLRGMIFKTAFAVSRDETRPVLNGVLWQVGNGRMTMVATDGHRLVKYAKSLSLVPEAEVVAEAIVPPRALNHLVKLMSAGSTLARVQFGQSHVMFDLVSSNASEETEAGRIRLFSRLIEGPYVDYEQVIPQNNGKRLQVSNTLLAPAVRRVAILSSSQTHQVRLKLGTNEIDLSANNQEIGGEARETLEADYVDEEMTIGYNSAYLLDILRRVDSDDVLLELDSPVSAGIIRPLQQPEGEDFLCLIMPLRIND